MTCGKTQFLVEESTWSFRHFCHLLRAGELEQHLPQLGNSFGLDGCFPLRCLLVSLSYLLTGDYANAVGG